MNIIKLTLLFGLLFPLQHINSQITIDSLHFLNGTWKVEKKSQYETWKILANGNLEGKGFLMKDNKEKVTEMLEIVESNKKITYIAKVLDQNDGLPVNFVLNIQERNKFSFENVNHDFPKKIIYTLINRNKLFIEVLGEGDKGFDYYMIR